MRERKGSVDVAHPDLAQAVTGVLRFPNDPAIGMSKRDAAEGASHMQWDGRKAELQIIGHGHLCELDVVPEGVERPFGCHPEDMAQSYQSPLTKHRENMHKIVSFGRHDSPEKLTKLG